MELRHLRCLVAVAEELHFGRAAERLHLSQPPVSQAIKELEAELGQRLFERNSRRIVLTAAGEEALRDARAVLARTEGLLQRGREATLGRGGRLAIGFISLAAYAYLPELLRRFSAEHSQVRLVLQESTTDQMLADLERGALDLGCVFASPQLPPTLAYQATNHDALVVALPAGHALAGLDRVPLERLAGEQFLAFERHHGPLMFDAMVSACMRHGFSPRIFPARQMHTIVSLVSGGIGVALVPASVQVMHRQGVVYRPLAGTPTLVEHGAAWRRDDDAPLLQQFIQQLPRVAGPA
ncbi:MAG: LysR family transcriptional regulator [Burkholderiaceae bacterium]|nr:LysR family transcriptional regulator [Burkholderiaceae bacterium]